MVLIKTNLSNMFTSMTSSTGNMGWCHKATVPQKNLQFIAHINLYKFCSKLPIFFLQSEKLPRDNEFLTMDGPKLSQIFLLWKKNTWWMVLLVSWTSFTLKFLTYNELYTIVQYCRLSNRYNFWLPMVILVVNFNFINISSNGILFMLMVTWAEITPDKYQNNEQNDNQMSVYTSDSAPISY